MKKILYFILIITLTLDFYDAQLLTTTCAGAPTCSPIQCTNVTNAACNPLPSTINVVEAVSQIPCNSAITQSNLDFCSNSSLLSIFAKGIGFGIKAIYCTDKYLVVHSDATPNHRDSLSLIPRPPGGGGSGSYDTQCVTKSREVQFFTFKIPLVPVELPAASLTNNIASFPTGSMLPTGIPIPIAGPVAVSVNGLPLFPPYNNRGELTWLVCELDGCNAHVGMGFDYHYHGDPFECMYSNIDYSFPASHPPLIAIGMDGLKVYGRHLSVAAEGYSIPLDICGGHSHGSYGYHYHSQVLRFNVIKSVCGS